MPTCCVLPWHEFGSSACMAIKSGKIKIQSPVLHLSNQTSGRTFVCGDIHGCFSLLEQKLEEVHFNAETDWVICVGDLIDRGPESIRALEFLAKPWFYSVMGNHESMLLNVLSGNMSMMGVWMHEGGSWFNQVDSPDQVSKWVTEISKLPIIIEVTTRHGVVGIVHADIPPSLSWEEFVQKVKGGDEQAVFYALKGRSRAMRRVCEKVAGAWRIYCGHTFVPKPRQLGNVWCIDTGAYLGSDNGKLTLMEISNVD